MHAAVDAKDDAALRALFSQHQVVAATIGPYYVFGARVLSAAIDAGCHYFDICDDPEPTLDMLALSDRAAAAGLTCVVGFGASPGLSNMLAALAAARVGGKPSRMITTWGSDRQEKTREPLHGAAVVHWVEQLTGTVLVQQDGKRTPVKPLQTVQLDVPTVGDVTLHTVGHPEAVTLPLSYPSVRESVNAMGFSLTLIEILKIIAERVDSGGSTVEQAANQLIEYTDTQEGFTISENARVALAVGKDAIFGTNTELPDIMAFAESDDGKIAAAWLNGVIPGGMGPVTGSPLAAAVHLFFQGKITKRGVVPPDQAADPDAFFATIAPLVVLDDPAKPLVVVVDGTTKL
ncbi:Saccharopine dehydrogenase-domain-containing protein [Hyaloraphidium curvatum]|nr:Saccharopine dehydrogenase-domain-containing protein [Hyaloraphidium curvatum]